MPVGCSDELFLRNNPINFKILRNFNIFFINISRKNLHKSEFTGIISRILSQGFSAAECSLAKAGSKTYYIKGCNHMFDDLYRQLLESVQSIVSSPNFSKESFTLALGMLFPLLSIFILAGAVMSLLTLPIVPEIWGKLVSIRDGKAFFLSHWENIIGSHKSSDIVIRDAKVSKQHAALIRNEKGEWRIIELGQSHGIYVNGEDIDEEQSLKYGDTISLAGYEVKLEQITAEEKRAREIRRRRFKPIPPWAMLVLLTFFQILAAFSLIVNKGDNASIYIIPSFFILTVVMWLYFIDMRVLGIQGFEMEIIAFYLSTLSLCVVGAYAPNSSLMKQAFSIIIGIVFMISFGIFLRNIKRVKMFRWIMAAATLGLLGFTMIFGKEKYGAINWVEFKGISMQLSEIAKLTYIFAGAATLDRLFKKRNIVLFIILTFASIGMLAKCSDFGTAAIFFITFLVLAYLRSGSIATISFVVSGALVGGLLIINAKPYIFKRFKSWGHCWDYIGTTGYQQANTQVAIANGDLLGVGAGNGRLSTKRVAAADTDLVFGMLCEEWGMIIAFLAILCILVLSAFAIRSCINSRSTYYTIAACAATSLLLFQTALNVFGAVDILPLTGVTFPFISNGGTSMIMAWGTLAFLKATDTRPNASFATRLKKSEMAPIIGKSTLNKSSKKSASKIKADKTKKADSGKIDSGKAVNKKTEIEAESVPRKRRSDSQ